MRQLAPTLTGFSPKNAGIKVEKGFLLAGIKPRRGEVKMTTQTTLKKEKRNIKNPNDEGVKIENTYKTQEKKSDDGRKTSISTEETYTREQQ